MFFFSFFLWMFCYLFWLNSHLNQSKVNINVFGFIIVNVYHYNDIFHSLGFTGPSTETSAEGCAHDISMILFSHFLFVRELDLECPFGSRKTWRRTSLAGATRPLMESDLLNGFGLLLALGLSPNWAPGAAWEKLIWYKLILWQWPWQGSGGSMDPCLLPHGDGTRCSRRQGK